MLPVKPFIQSKAYCGPAVLKMVLEYFGVEKSEKELAKLCCSNRNLGTHAKDIVRVARSLGFKTLLKDFADISDIRMWVKKKTIPVIVDWFETDDGHYSVVADIDMKYIYLQDPALGRIRRLDIATFKRIWFDFRDRFESKQAIVIRRLIVIYPTGKRNYSYPALKFPNSSFQFLISIIMPIKQAMAMRQASEPPKCHCTLLKMPSKIINMTAGE